MRRPNPFRPYRPYMRSCSRINTRLTLRKKNGYQKYFLSADRGGSWPLGTGMNLNQSSMEKMMAAVHFTTIPCEPYTAHKLQGKPYFIPMPTTLRLLGLEVLEILACQ